MTTGEPILRVAEIAGLTALLVAEERPPLGATGQREVGDVIGEALAAGADVVVVPVARLGDAFFQLRTGVAGEVLQRMANYRLTLAVVGDIAPYVAASTAFRDLVREADRGTSLLFVPDVDSLRSRLDAPPKNRSRQGQDPSGQAALTEVVRHDRVSASRETSPRG